MNVAPYMFRILVAAFVIMAIHALWHDLHALRTPPVGFDVDAAAHIHQSMKDSRVRRMSVSVRDQIFRGVVMGMVDGGGTSIAHNAATWALTSGIITGMSDAIGWRTRLHAMTGM